MRGLSNAYVSNFELDVNSTSMVFVARAKSGLIQSTRNKMLEMYAYAASPRVCMYCGTPVREHKHSGKCLSCSAPLG